MKSIWRIIGKIIFRTFLLIFTTALLLVGGAVGLVYTLNYGPSPSARNLFVTSVLETSAMGFLATWFLPTEEVQTILATNTVAEFDVITNPDLVTIVKDTTGQTDSSEQSEASEEKDIEVVEVSGLTYVGRMMIIKDPSRVYVGVCKNLGDETKSGDFLTAMVERDNAIAGINGGGFLDVGGKGTGSIPNGFVFANGELLWGPTDQRELLIGFDMDDKLIVGYMTGNEAIKRNIRDALTFGPALIVNGVPATISGGSSGLNPRSAIGQRADGAVLLLSIDGRQASSLGATMSDLIEIMVNFGAVNAANLDGGTSSSLIYDGVQISNPLRLMGERTIATSFLVERRPSDEE